MRFSAVPLDLAADRDTGIRMDSDHEIVMAVHNGESYLNAQLESLRRQQIMAHRILIGDDGSSDGSPWIIREFARSAQMPLVLSRTRNRLGATGNFGDLLESTRTEYVFLCDQDDVWDAHKTRLCLEHMQGLTARLGKHTPLMLFTDLRVTDAGLKPVADSFWRLQGIEPSRTRLVDLLFQNVATGCTVVVNRALLRLALPFPPGLVMHDWWLAMVASVFGHLSHLPVTTLSYRQHGNNQIGARPADGRYLYTHVRLALGRRQAAMLLLPYIHQARCFLAQFGSRLHNGNLDLLRGLADLDRTPPNERLAWAMRHRLSKHCWLRSAGLYTCMVRAPQGHWASTHAPTPEDMTDV